MWMCILHVRGHSYASSGLVLCQVAIWPEVGNVKCATEVFTPVSKVLRSCKAIWAHIQNRLPPHGTWSFALKVVNIGTFEGCNGTLPDA